MGSSILFLSPYNGESFSSYLGRWCRQEVVSIDSYSLENSLQLGKTLWRWQNFYLNPRPTTEELQKIDSLLELGLEKLLLMFPPESEEIKSLSNGLCQR